ncbi:MAG: nucleotidyltransferase domain-containing protein [Nitrospirae bacterium]|nr:nucleotidyltransferase domain-containing protein [Nitrospirota bacterium]
MLSDRRGDWNYRREKGCSRRKIVVQQKDYEIAKELKKRLSEVVNLIDFRIFGSRARGEADEYSDMDVFIEVEYLDKQLKEKIRNITWEVGFENSIYISPLIFTRYEIEDSPLRASPIVKNIAEEGVKV